MWGNLLSPEHHSSSRLAQRRRKNHFRVLITLSVLFFIAICLAFYGLWQPAVRISNIVVYGADQSLADVARAAMQGNYLGVIPLDSTFFFPEERIRQDIIAAHSDIAAVSIFRDGLTSISIKVDYRTPVARWCGVPPDASSSDASLAAVVMATASSTSATSCYLFDASGFVYATTTSSASVNNFAVYESLSQTGDPVGTVLPNAGMLPSAFDFARQLSAFGTTVVAVVFNDNNEVDDYLASGTRIMYVLGSEQDAYTALLSAKADTNLADGSIDYVDLRFPGKVYLKKK